MKKLPASATSFQRDKFHARDTYKSGFRLWEIECLLRSVPFVLFNFCHDLLFLIDRKNINLMDVPSLLPLG
jgi:hypothetical protein